MKKIKLTKKYIESLTDLDVIKAKERCAEATITRSGVSTADFILSGVGTSGRTLEMAKKRLLMEVM